MIHKLDPARCGWVRTDGPHMWLLVTCDKYRRLYWSWQLRLPGLTESGVGGVAQSWDELERDAEASLSAAWGLVRERVILWEANNEPVRAARTVSRVNGNRARLRCESGVCVARDERLLFSLRSKRGVQ